jgi:hypothetical protein
LTSAESGLDFLNFFPPSQRQAAMARQARELRKLKIILKILLAQPALFTP